MADLDDIINTLIAEANAEGPEGMRRVAETILNRAAIRGIDPAAVVRQPSQYTGYFAPGDLALQAQRNPQVRTAAEAAWQLAKQPGDPTNGADHYFNPNVVNPGWQNSMESTGDYGDHAFYRSRAVPADALARLLTPTAPVPRMPPARGNVPSDLIANSLAANSAAQGRRSLADMFGPPANSNTPRLTQAGTVTTPSVSSSDWANNIFPNTARRSAPMIAQSNLTMPGAVDDQVAALQRGISPSTQAAIEAWVKPKPQMTAAQQRSDNGQNRPAARAVQVADAFNGDPRSPSNGPVLASVPTSNIGKPPTTRVVQSVPWSAPAPKQTTAQIRSDNGQNRPAVTARQTPLTIGVTPSAAPRMDAIGDMGSFGDIASMFGPQIPQARQSVNNNKDQTRLTNTSVIGQADDAVLAAHGLLPNPPPASNVPLPRKRPVPAAQPSRVAITQPRKVAPVPAAAALRPTGTVQGRIAAPMITPRAQVQRAPLRVVVQGGNYQEPASGSWAPQGYTNDGTGKITSNETGGVYYERHLR